MHPHHLAALAQGPASASGPSSVVSVAVTLVILLLVMVRRVRGRELLTRRLLILPFILLLLGAGSVIPQLAPKSAPVHLHGIDYLVLGTDLALSVVIGSVRGFTVLIYPKDGTTWYRYGPVTVLLWLLSIALRTALGIIGARHGAQPLVTSGVVLLMFGLTLLIQNSLVAARAARSLAPAIPAGRR